MAAVEPIRQALDIAGEALYFPNFDILSFPGFNVSVLYKNEVSVYEVEKQNFTFQVASEDVFKFKVKAEMEFYFKDKVYEYSFKLDRNAEHDLTGWSKLYCNFISRKEC